MLVIKDQGDGQVYDFFLNNIALEAGSNIFKLTCAVYPELVISLKLQPPEKQLPVGYTVSVHLFKNPFHKQQNVLEIRSDGVAANNGRLGYMFQLDALFEPGLLDLDRHTYCYAYFAAQYLFSNALSFQTKETEVKSDPYKITDFFDEDTIILVLCDQYCHIIPDFDLNHYLADFFLKGFTGFNKEVVIRSTNLHSYIEANYNDFTSPVTNDATYVLRPKRPNLSIANEAYVIHLFSKLIQSEFDQVTRFLMLYQVVEIFMPKVVPLEVNRRLCTHLHDFDASKIKDLLGDLAKQQTLIKALFNRYAKPTNSLEITLRQEILDFFIHVDHPEFRDITKHPNLTLVELFYALRNKIVHEYRILHTQGVDPNVTIDKINIINQLTEAFVAEMITIYSG